MNRIQMLLNRTGGAAMCAVPLFLGLAARAAYAQTDWPTYGHDPGNTRHSPLKQIDAKNVGNLKQAWSYHMFTAPTAEPVAPPPAQDKGKAKGGRGGGGGMRGSEASPIVVGGVMYLPSPYNKVLAIEPETGKELWVYDIPNNGNAAARGVEYWPGDAQSPATIFFGTTTAKLVALNAKTGKPIPGFGNEGSIDMKQGIDNGFPQGQFSLSSPPKMYKNLIITGARVQEQPAMGYAGDTRAWDAHTGKLVWQFHNIPQPGETGADTWQGEDWKGRSGANTWGIMSIDATLGMVYLPVASPSYDFYGGDRPGANLFGNSIVALDAATGKLKWHFQMVHHDIWDYDPAAAPIFFDVTRGGTRTPALAITSKSGLVFILDRRTGKPIYDVQERPIPKSPVPGEQAWPTEPFPTKPAPLSRMSFSAEEIAKVTPEQEKFCRDLLATDGGMAFGGPFNAYEEKMTINFPGTWGATNWHGGSFDPTTGYLYFNTLNLADTGKLTKNTVQGKTMYTRGGFSRFWNGEKFWPCQAPPWGEMVAINVNTGDYAWRVPFGIIPELEAQGVKGTGTLNMGGSATTASGLVFIGASNDRHFRAFDGKTGKVVWDIQLDAGAYGSPIVYQGKDGKEYVAFVAAGGAYMDRQTGDSILAYRLP